MDYHNAYIAILNEYKVDNTKYYRWKMFELLIALELDMILWENAKNMVKKYVTLPATNDYGTDLIDLEFTRTVQVKSRNVHVTHVGISTYVNHSVWWLGIPQLILAIEDTVTYNEDVKTSMPQILVYNFKELMEKVPSTSIDTIFKVYIGPKKLTPEEKIKEFISYVDQHGMPKYINIKCSDERVNFSDGTNMYLFWENCKRMQKYNLPMYSDLLSHPIIGSNCEVRKTKPMSQINYIINCCDEYGIQKCNNLVYWIECKKNNKCLTYPWSILLRNPVLRKDYKNYLSSNYVFYKKLFAYIKDLKNNLSLDHEFWILCRNTKMYDEWPCCELLKITELRKDRDAHIGAERILELCMNPPTTSINFDDKNFSMCV